MFKNGRTDLLNPHSNYLNMSQGDGNLIQSLREQLKLSVEEVAQRTRLSVPALLEIENGEKSTHHFENRQNVLAYLNSLSF